MPFSSSRSSRRRLREAWSSLSGNNQSHPQFALCSIQYHILCIIISLWGVRDFRKLENKNTDPRFQVPVRLRKDSRLSNVECDSALVSHGRLLCFATAHEHCRLAVSPWHCFPSGVPPVI